MPIQDIGYGGIGGLTVAVLTFLGWNRRLNRLEDCKQDKAVCDVRHEIVKKISEDLDYIKERIDKLANGCVEKKE